MDISDDDSSSDDSSSEDSSSEDDGPEPYYTNPDQKKLQILGKIRRRKMLFNQTLDNYHPLIF